ncbi:hypothetical protein AB0I81_34725 [Nonomuraea sp. NPDC050404]|uniref:DUF6907 domain-containing protein n=1 Tax=Nonomuraea sp. NPDC050404 TaxID=3155783 RepID=UPI0033F3F590
MTITCPEWCTESHLASSDAVLHRADVRAVALGLEGAGRGYTPTLFIELVQQVPSEAGPVIKLRVGEQVIARLMPGEALAAALRLIGLIGLVMES